MMIHKTNNESVHIIGRINHKKSSRFIVQGTTRGLASHNIRNPNAIHNKRQDWNHNEKLPQASRKNDASEIPLKLQSKRL